MKDAGGLATELLLYAVYEYEYVSVFVSVSVSGFVFAVVGDRTKCVMCTVPSYPIAGLLQAIMRSAHHYEGGQSAECNAQRWPVYGRIGRKVHMSPSEILRGRARS